MGGEEFMIVCPGMSERDAIRVGESIVSDCAAACASELTPGWEQRTSVGLAVYPIAAIESEALMKSADVALYRSKSKGGNSVSVGSGDQ
jgi:diguanylate cyclase (GGDEF)-like protein